ncbi:MAG: SDR family oxidoreductase [Actinomycetes bacterium]
MHVLIAGCGYVGTALGLRLAAEGHDVTGIRRSPERIPAPIRAVGADLTDPATLDAVPPDVDAVVVTASADGRDPDLYRAAYVDGPTTLLAFLAERGDPVRRVLFTSSSAVYGQADGELVDEDSPTEPSSPTGRILVEAERAVLDGPFPATVLRLTGIYGPGRTRLVDQVRAGEATCGPGPDPTNRIHRDDCASALAHLLTLDDPADVYLGTDDDPAERCEVLTWLAAQVGAPAPRVVEDGGSSRGNKRCSNARLRASGWAPTHPTFREGYAAMLAGEA